MPQDETATPARACLVRIAVRDRDWSRTLPVVPGGHRLTVTLGHADLTPGPDDDPVASGYRVVGIAADHRPLGFVVDVLVPVQLCLDHPGWWQRLSELADRVFDLAFGPVARVLAPEIDVHHRAMRSA